MATPPDPQPRRRRDIGLVLRLAGIAVLVAFVLGLLAGLQVVAENRYWAYGAWRNLSTELGRATVSHILGGLAWAGGLLVLAILSRAAFASRPGATPRRVFARAIGVFALVGVTYVMARSVVPLPPAASSVKGILVDLALLAGAVGLVLALGQPWGPRMLASRPALWLARLGVVAGLAAAVSALAPVLLRAPASPDRPNVLLVVIDTLRADRLGLYGHDPDNAPRLRELAQTSTFFRRAVSHAPWTSPSVASLLTSRFPGEMGFADSQGPKMFPRQLLVLPEMLRERGYETVAFVSHTFVGRQIGFDQGFDLWDQENARGADHVSSPSLADKASRFLRERRRGDPPFFLLVHFFDPHFRYLRHPGDADASETSPGRGDGSEMTAEDLDRPTSEVARRALELYDGEIRFTDRYVGHLLDELRELGIFDETLIVVAADHGEMFMDRGIPSLGHGTTLYQELIHVPVIVHVPGQTRGFVVDEPVGLIDVVPSLAKLLGLSVPDDAPLRGRALPLGGPEAWSEVPAAPQFAETLARGRWLQSAILGRWKLVVDRHSGRRELYDLVRDPGETEDQAGQEVEVANRLSEAIEAWNGRLAAGAEGVKSRDAELTEAEREQLEALGYAQ